MEFILQEVFLVAIVKTKRFLFQIVNQDTEEKNSQRNLTVRRLDFHKKIHQIQTVANHISQLKE